MSRPRKPVRRATASFYVSTRVMAELQAVLDSFEHNPMRLSRPEVVELLMRSFIDGHIRFVRPDYSLLMGSVDVALPLLPHDN